MSRDIVGATIEEVRSDREVDRGHVLARLDDWRARVHGLFDFVEASLGAEFTFNRTGKWRSQEELVQRVGLEASQSPAVDILRIEKPLGSLRAVFVPRGLWVVGANGRLDLRVSYPKPEQYLVVDRSRPLEGPPEWFLIHGADRLSRHPFTKEVVNNVIGAGF